MYVPNQPRYFGTVADYGSLFSFVRANAQYFDDFEEIADVMLVVDEDSATLDTLPGAAQVCLDLGAAFRLSVLRPNSVTGNHSAPFNPQAVVAVNCPTSNVTTLFPGVPVRALSDLQANGSDPALKRVIRTITPDPQRIVAVPRINRRSGVLLIHVVDATKSSEGFRSAQYLDIMVPKPYWPYFKGIQHALLVRPNGDPAKRPLSITQDSETMKIRAPLSGISGWGILVFDRNMA